jgi:hypothetical protein
MFWIQTRKRELHHEDHEGHEVKKWVFLKTIIILRVLHALRGE